MTGLMLFAGWCLLIGGLIQIGASLVMRRRGTQWRGTALGATALALWGALTLAGVLANATLLGAAAVCVIAGAVWAGLLLNLWEARKLRSVR